MPRSLLACVLLAGTLLFAGCSSGSQSGNVPAPAGGGAAAPAGAAQPAVVPAAPSRQLVLTASVTLRAKDPWAVSDLARSVATDLKGDVLSLQRSGAEEKRSARLVMRVPADRFDAALERIGKLDAELVASATEAKDVSDQFVDLTARLVSKQREEQQYLSVLTQARAVDDILKIDQALARVRTEIEQLQGTLNGLTARVDFSTITVAIESVADFTTTSTWAPLRTAALAFVTLVGLLKLLGDTVIWILIVGWLPALLLAGFVYTRSWYRRRFPRASAPAPVSSAPPGPPSP